MICALVYLHFKDAGTKNMKGIEIRWQEEEGNGKGFMKEKETKKEKNEKEAVTDIVHAHLQAMAYHPSIIIIIIIMLDLYSASLCYHLYALYIIIRQS